MFKQAVRCFVLSMVFTACGKVTTQIGHTLPNTPARKPTSDCVAADADLNKILLNTSTFSGSSVTYLSNGTCAVLVQLKDHTNALNVAKKIKSKTDMYSFILEGKSLISIWIDEPAAPFPAMDFPSDDECRAAASSLQSSFTSATISPVFDNRSEAGRKRCYVDASFPSDASYEAFLAWNKDGEIFHLHHARPDGTVATIYIRATAALQN